MELSNLRYQGNSIFSFEFRGKYYPLISEGTETIGIFGFEVRNL
jgi:hypothetical protein